MKNRTIVLWIFIIISIISTSALITLVVVKPHFRMENRDNHHHFNDNNQEYDNVREMLVEKLNLNEEQIQLFQQEKVTHFATVEPVFDTIMIVRSALFEELKIDNPDTIKVNEYVEQIANLERILQMESVHHMLNLKSFLDPVQVDSLFAFFSSHMMPTHGTHHRKTGRVNNYHCR